MQGVNYEERERVDLPYQSEQGFPSAHQPLAGVLMWSVRRNTSNGVQEDPERSVCSDR
jgi:hypothetical protein